MVVDVSDALRAIRSDRARYSDEQVGQIREWYLIEKRTLKWIRANVHPQSSESAIYKIAVGLAYADVPLTERLQEAAWRAQNAGKAVAAAALGAGAGPEPTGPVRAEELLSEGDWA